MQNYSMNDIVDILLAIGECFRNYSQAGNIYVARVPNRQYSVRRTICKIKTRLHQEKHRRKRSNLSRSDTNEADNKTITFLDSVHINPKISIREIESQFLYLVKIFIES